VTTRASGLFLGWFSQPGQMSVTTSVPGATDRAMTSCRVFDEASGICARRIWRGLVLRGKLHRADDEDLAHRAAAALPAARRIVVRAERHLRPADPDQRSQQTAVGIDHRAAQPGEQEPGGLATADPGLRLKLQRRQAVEMEGKKVGSREPGRQRKVAGLQDRCRRHRSLPPTARALPARLVPVRFPAHATAAGGAGKALRPTPHDEEPRADGITVETRLEILVF